MLVPRRNGLREVIDLPPEVQQQLWGEVALASQAIQVRRRQLPSVRNRLLLHACKCVRTSRNRQAVALTSA